MSTVTDKNKEIKSEKDAVIFLDLNGDFSKVPKKFMTKKVVEAAFRANPYSKTYVWIPESLRTFAMCLRACPDYGAESKDFAEWAANPNWGISPSGLVALKKKGTLPHFKKDTPDETKIVCYNRAFQDNTSLVKSMPDFVLKQLSTAQAHKIAKAGMIEFLPEKIITEEIVEAYQKAFDGSLKDVPQEYLTYEMCESSVKKTSVEISNVPEHFINEELCEIAIEKSSENLKHLPDNFKERFYTKAAKGGWGFSHIPEEDRTDKLCTIAVQARGENLEHVPEDKKSYAIILTAVDQSAKAYKFIPEDLEDDDNEVKLRALITYFSNRSGWEAEEVIQKMLKGFNYDHERAELIVEVVKRDSDLFEQIADNHRRNREFQGCFLRQEVCIQAFKGDRSNIKYIPHSVLQDVLKHYIELTKEEE